MPDNQTIRATIQNIDVYLVRASNHQITNLVFPIYYTNFSQLEQLIKNKLFIGSKQVFLGLGPMKNSKMLKLRKFRKQNWGKQDWLFGGFMSRTR